MKSLKSRPLHDISWNDRNQYTILRRMVIKETGVRFLIKLVRKLDLTDEVQSREKKVQLEICQECRPTPLFSALCKSANNLA
jgi:hypothetical protein